MFIDFDRSINVLGNQNIYIWGLGVFGLCVVKYIKKKGLVINGIIDKNANEIGNFDGIKVYDSQILEKLDASNSIILITATTPNAINEIEKQIKETHKSIEYRILQGGSVYIDISGMCNLRCASCPVGNSSPGTFTKTSRGFMLPETYEMILDKIKTEMPQKRVVYLYIFGDPLLSPYLFDIIDITHKKDMFAVVSTNFSLNPNFDKLMEHAPDCIKVSISGFSQKVYETTHNGGNVELVKRNLYLLSEMMLKKNGTTTVLLGYHRYKNNTGDEEIRMRDLCNELGFVFQVKKGVYWNNLKRLGLEPFSQDDISFINTYCIDGDVYLDTKSIYNNEQLYCGYLDGRDKSLFIDWDGSVMLCCNFRSDSSIFPYSYLDVPMDIIQTDRSSHFLCRECMKHGINF